MNGTDIGNEVRAAIKALFKLGEAQAQPSPQPSAVVTFVIEPPQPKGTK